MRHVRFHIVADGGPLCNQRSIVAQVNAADCILCNRRLAVMLDIVHKAALGQECQVAALELLDAMGYEAEQGRANV
jgi:hypothetical protein